MRLPLLSASIPASPPLEIAGVPVRISPRARRMALRAEARTGRIVLTLPQRQKWTDKIIRAAEDFVTQNRAWILRHEGATGTASAPIAPGGTLCVGGVDYVLAHQPGRGVSRFDGGQIIITGDITHFARRLRDFLKQQAGDMLTALTHEKTAQLGLPPREVRLRDPATRWGSCGPDGRIMYSWRLILTPPFVMDYVVAHEVAHRVHMDHSRAFWRVCLSLTTRGTEARRWLRAHGAEVMKV